MNFGDDHLLKCVILCNIITINAPYSQSYDEDYDHRNVDGHMSSLICTRWWRRDEVDCNFHVNLWRKPWYHKNPLKYRNLKIDETVYKLTCNIRQSKENTSSMICISSLLDASIKYRCITQYNRRCYRRGYNDV